MRTIDWLDGRIRIIDQTRLPAELCTLDITEVDELVGHISSLAVRGAMALGVAGALGMALAAARATESGEDLDSRLSAAADALTGKIPVRHGGTEQVGALHFLKVFGVDLRVIPRHERLQRRTKPDVDALRDEPRDLLVRPCTHALDCSQETSVGGGAA